MNYRNIARMVLMGLGCAIVLAGCQDASVELQPLNKAMPEQVGLELTAVHEFVSAGSAQDFGSDHARSGYLEYRLFQIRNLGDTPAQVLPDLSIRNSDLTHFDLVQRFLDSRPGEPVFIKVPYAVNDGFLNTTVGYTIVAEPGPPTNVVSDFHSAFEIIEALLVFSDGRVEKLDLNRVPDDERVANAPSIAAGESAEVRFRLKLTSNYGIVRPAGKLCQSRWALRSSLSLAYRGSGEVTWSSIFLSPKNPVLNQSGEKRSASCPEANANAEISGLAGA